MRKVEPRVGTISVDAVEISGRQDLYAANDVPNGSLTPAAQ
jgi:hypothetical protein